MNTLSDHLRNLLENLRYIALIKPGHKMNISSRDYSDTTSTVDTIRRTIHRLISGESRQLTVETIQRWIAEAFSALESYHDSVYYQDLVTALAATVKGLNNLKDTYSDCVDIVIKLDVIILDIERHLAGKMPPKKAP